MVSSCEHSLRLPGATKSPNGNEAPRPTSAPKLRSADLPGLDSQAKGALRARLLGTPARNNRGVSFRVSSVACIGLIALLAKPAVSDAAPPLGSPPVLRTAAEGDLVGRPHARTEWWRLRGVDRRTGAWFELYLLRDGGLWGSSLLVVDEAGAERRGALDLGPARSGRRRLTARAVGSLTIERARGGFRVALDDPEATATLRLRGVRRGPAALGWRTRPRPAGGTRQDGMSWAAPVATSVLAGSLSIRGAPRTVTDWRASYEHGWGTSTSQELLGSAGISSSCTAPAGPRGCCTDSTDATQSKPQETRTSPGSASSPA